MEETQDPKDYSSIEEYLNENLIAKLSKETHYLSFTQRPAGTPGNTIAGLDAIRYMEEHAEEALPAIKRLVFEKNELHAVAYFGSDPGAAGTVLRIYFQKEQPLNL